MYQLINQNISAIPINPLRRLFEQAKPNALNLASGHPAQTYNDTQHLIQATNKASQESESWRYGASKGDDDLIGLLKEKYAIPACDDLIVTAGAQQGIDLVLRTLTQPKGIFLLPEKAYPAALSAAIMNGLTPVNYTIEQDDESLCELRSLLEKIERPCALYALPTFANPSSKTLTLLQREHLLSLACEFDFPILEDDPYRDLWFNESPPLTLYDLNIDKGTQALVIHLGSFSKIISPGLRVGWVQGPENLLSYMVNARQSSDLQPNSLAQRVVYHYLVSGRLAAHLVTLRTELSSTHQAFIKPLRDAGFIQLEVEGGLFVMPFIGKTTTAQSLSDALLQESIIVVPGNAFLLDQQRPSYHIRLCFGSLTIDNAERAGSLLSNAIRKLL